MAKKTTAPVWPEKLSKFLTYCQEAEQPFADFYPVTAEPNFIKTLVPDAVAQHLTIIGKHGSGSLIAFWHYKPEVNLEALPLVWLDSEGSPSAVFAANYLDFLALLPYGTGFIYDVLSSWTYFLEEPGSYKNPAKKFTAKRLEFYLAFCRDSFSGYDPFIQWLDSSLQIKKHSDPVNAIGNAYKSFPKLPLG